MNSLTHALSFLLAYVLLQSNTWLKLVHKRTGASKADRYFLNLKIPIVCSFLNNESFVMFEPWYTYPSLLKFLFKVSSMNSLFSLNFVSRYS